MPPRPLSFIRERNVLRNHVERQDYSNCFTAVFIPNTSNGCCQEPSGRYGGNKHVSNIDCGTSHFCFSSLFLAITPINFEPTEGSGTTYTIPGGHTSGPSKESNDSIEWINFANTSIMARGQPNCCEWAMWFNDHVMGMEWWPSCFMHIDRFELILRDSGRKITHGSYIARWYAYGRRRFAAFVLRCPRILLLLAPAMAYIMQAAGDGRGGWNEMATVWLVH